MNNSYNKASKTKTQQKLSSTLINLMSNKNINDITVNELTTQAGVGRISFYRYYGTKEEILRDYLQNLFNNFYQENFTLDPNNIVFITQVFKFVRKNNLVLNSLINSRLEYLWLDVAMKYTETYRKNKPQDDNWSDIEISFLVGGLQNVAINWIKNGMEESYANLAAKVEKYFLV